MMLAADQRPPGSAARHAMIIPMVIMALVIMSILGVVLMSSSTSEYAQSALVAYGLRARELAIAALEEAQGSVYDLLNRPDPVPDPAFRQRVFDACAAAAGSGNRGPVMPAIDLMAGGFVRRALALAGASGGTIAKAEAELLGFRPVEYSRDSGGVDAFRVQDSFYTDPDGKLDPPGEPDRVAPPREFVGYVRIRVEARFGKVSRLLSQVHDVKIVQAVPPAREFVVFSALSTFRGQPGGPPSDDYGNQDLNQGGALKIFANGRGRIFLRGPYTLETEGERGNWTRGAGGAQPRLTNEYFDDRWHGWKMIPALRDGIVSRAGPPIINFGLPAARPDSRSGWRVLPGGIRLLIGGLGVVLDDDPGYYILDGQKWYCETRGGVNPRSFSICGEPVVGAGLNLFRGVVVKNSGGNRAPIGDVLAVWPGSDVNGLPDLGGNEDLLTVEPEGALIGRYNVARYTYDQIDFLLGTYERYRLHRDGTAAGRYGIHWEPRREESYWSRLVGDLLAQGMRIALFAAAPMLPLSGLEIFIIGVVTGITATDMSTMLLNALGLGPGRLGGLTNVETSRVRKALPPDFRPLSRMVTRRYPSLAMLPPLLRPGPPPVLVLDGVLGFDNLSAVVPFFYRGKGFMFTEAIVPPRMPAPISPVARQGLTAANNTMDYLTIYHGAPGENAYLGGSMLNIEPSGGASSGTVVASVFSTQGVRSSRRVVIQGNLVCGYVNKSRIPSSGTVHVKYQPGRLSAADRAQYRDGRWHVIALSHRPCHVHDR
jgi:hypothetical protein